MEDQTFTVKDIEDIIDRCTTRYPFYVEAGLLFGMIRDEAGLNKIYVDQMEIAGCTREEAEATINRLRMTEVGIPSFRESPLHTGPTLAEYLADRPD